MLYLTKRLGVTTRDEDCVSDEVCPSHTLCNDWRSVVARAAVGNLWPVGLIRPGMGCRLASKAFPTNLGHLAHI